MKKLLGSMLALAMFVPAGANAELLKNLKMSGRVDLQGTSARNVTDFNTKRYVTAAVDAVDGQDQIGDMQTRIMVSLDWDLLDDVHSRTTLRKNDRVWGNASQRVSDGAANTGVLNNVWVDEAFIKIDKLFGTLDTTLGRQFVGEEGDLVAYYGPKTNLYGLGVDALDAAKFDAGGENWTLTALTGKPAANNGALGVVANGQQDIRALIVGNKGNENVSGKVQLWNKRTRNTAATLGTPPNTVDAGGVDDNLYVLGLKAKVMAGPAWLKAEFDKNFGTHRVTDTDAQAGSSRHSGWAGLLNAGAKVDVGMGMVTGWGEFGYGTGNKDTRSNKRDGFESINSDYRPGSLYGRFAQISNGNLFANNIGATLSPASNGLSNRIVKGLGVKFTPAAADKLTVALSAWDFWFQNAGRKLGPAAQPAIGANSNRHIGNEYDMELAWQHSENVLVKLGAASFQAGGFIQESMALTNNQRGNSPAYMFTSDVSVKF